MCGIAGFCGPDKRFSANNLRSMLRAITHRGPDDSGVFTTPVLGRPGFRICLGSVRLAIQDISSAGHQPMLHKDSGDAIAFNGEIYNFRELRTMLERQNVVFRSSCDTEVALESWRHGGTAAIRSWRGMFGAALWDQRSETLVLVRDPWGIKPLYYFWDGEYLAFCSEVRGLLASGVVPRRLEWRGVQDYLTFGSVQDPVTMIGGVYALLPGHLLRWSKGRIDVLQFASPFDDDPGDTLDLESTLRTIVRQQLISDVPVTVFLSGGIDSSVVSLLARQESGSGISTTAVVFEEEKYSERRYARAVAKAIGTDHQEVLLRSDQIAEKALDAVKCMDQPSSDGINNYVISEAARKAGFKVALSGLGGDEFFGGYATFRRTPKLARALRCCRRARPLVQAAARAAAPGLMFLEGAPRKFAQYLRYATFDEHPYFLQRTMFFPAQISRLCPAATPSPAADADANGYNKQLLEQASHLDLSNQISYLEARTYMANTLLRDSDQMSMAHSLELRVPLVDHKLAAWLFALSGESKSFGRVPKFLLRRAFERQLPKEVFTRRKMGFTLPFEIWLRSSLRRELEQTLGSGAFWPRSAALTVWRDFQAGNIDWSRPWALYVLSRWISRHVPECADREPETIGSDYHVSTEIKAGLPQGTMSGVNS